MNRTWTKRIPAAVLVICLLCCLVTLGASALSTPPEDGKGTVTITTDPAFEGVPQMMVEIGTFEGMIITPNETFQEFDFEHMVNAGEYVDMAAKLEGFVLSHDLSGTYSWVDRNGRTVFSDVPVDRAYVIVQTAGEEIVKIQPLIVTMPGYLEGQKEPEYDFQLTAKFEDNRNKDYQGAVILNKVGYKNARLEGAEFSFWQKVYVTDVTTLPEGSEVAVDAGGTYYWKRLGGVLTTDEHGQITVSKLPFGMYRFIEEKAPDGYVLDKEPHEFPITQHGKVTTENELYVEEVAEVVELNIKNEPVPTTSISEQSFPSTPTSTPDTPPPPETHLTGEDIAKFVIIFSVVGVSLVAVILLLALGARKKKK